MKMKIMLAVFTVIALIAGGYGYMKSRAAKSNAQYQFAEITRGNLESTISSSGTLSPVTTVQVGTQVSGTIDRIFADFNDRVKKGQLLAVLDTVLLKASLMDAQANLERAQAQLDEAQTNYDRNKTMFDQALISEADFLPFQINLKMQRATLKSAGAALQRAERNLHFAYIYSPISGTVIQRNVEAGQTVAASLSAPVLFEIAEDLSQMEILAEVDESDIGLIRQGQEVRFTVQAHPDHSFTGTVRQIRLQPQVISNVVTYTVVVDAANPDNLLLPGMTATLDFVVSQKSDVLLVPNTALRFQPSAEAVAEFRERRQREMASLPDSLRQGRRGRGEGGGPAGDGASRFGGRGGGNDFKQVWYLDNQGQLTMAPVRIGMSDGIHSEIIRSRNLEEGMQVITGATQDSEAASRTNANNRGFTPGRSRPF